MSECVKVLRDELPYNLHIFVNSVEFIAKVIDTLKLAPEAVKVVCSTSGESRQENQRKLGNAYPIGQPSDPAKKDKLLHLDLLRGVRHLRPRRRYIHRQRRTKGAHAVGYFNARSRRYADASEIPVTRAQIVHVYSTTKYSQAVTLDEFVAATQRTLADADKLCRRDKLVE